ncbi:3-deoxy-D-manno-octulosonic acid transferase [Anaerophaga thermohalophila]|jgi:3-deoxy-D-manno-octulosonic-acid transferase|uniref:3-deoxy-D-manno-octulosonic acid transferase n=1 Tax=Anaerophaga thermohalophila TaxID=177400 RepID=UPI0002FA0CBA|nr:glycosyltransferase N-terminal domain-containing protein [Anaerophaga thermohalophila]
MRILYITGIRIFSLLLFIASFFNEKARLLRNGRKKIWQQVAEMKQQGPFVWVHCSSLGEFEQGRPVIEAIKKEHPGKRVLLTFFSPSGYEIRKNYEMADQVVYLPADTPKNARRFVDLVNPESALFIKYEFWPCFFETLQQRNIPVYSISSIFRKNQIFFRWYGRWFRKTLKAVNKFYVQDNESGRLLKEAGINNFSVAGDTRFDRVTAIVKASTDVPIAASFSEGAPFIIVAGSTWPPDEDILIRYINSAPGDVKLIIAPHEVHQSHIEQIEQRLKVPYIKYSATDDKIADDAKVLIVNTIGLLSAIYRYGQVAYIGGGFGKGIHNTLEAATYGIPVVFGPRYQKFKEARDLISRGGGFSIRNYDTLFALMEKLRNSPEYLNQTGNASAAYVKSMCGATDVIMKEVFPLSEDS